MPTKYKRNGYGAVVQNQMPLKTLSIVKKLVEEASYAEKVDEHGSWEFQAEFDNKGRGYATNWDIYDVGKDYHNKGWLAIIQIRQWVKQSRRGFASTKKSYFLLGRNEDKTVFAHPVSAHVKGFQIDCMP